MKLTEFEDRYLRHAFASACAYETFAVITGKSPTISAAVRRVYSNPAGRVVLWLCWGWVLHHLTSDLDGR